MSFDLFNLIPAVYRIRDMQIAQSLQLLTPAESAELTALQALTPPLPSDQQAQLDLLTAKASLGPLQSLLQVIQEQIGIFAEDLNQLYDDQFIETCAKWVIPYIGDLIGYQSVRGIAPSVDNPRSEVANTIAFRRRKGTILVMEELARDATGWGTHAVEFFRVLADTQYMNHLRLWNHYAPDLRHWQPGLYMDTGFDRTAHKVDVRRIASNRGRYNVQNIGIFLWSQTAFSITEAPAAVSSVSPLCFRFNSLGMDAPLFHRAVSQGEEITTAAQPVNVADRLRRRVLCEDIRKGVGAEYYGEGNSLAIYLNGKVQNPYQIQVADLSGPDGAWINLPSAASEYVAVVDPELGRIALPPPSGASPALPHVNVSFYYGFNAKVGGGEYSRSSGFEVTDPARIVPFPDPRFADLQAALDFAVTQLALNGQVAVEVSGNALGGGGSESSFTYSLAAPLTVHLPAETTLELRALDLTRPTLFLDGEISITGEASSTFILNGFVVGAVPGMAPATPAPVSLVHIPKFSPDGTLNQLEHLKITHSTLVPGWSVGTSGAPNHPASPTIVAEPSGTTTILTNSIVGSIQSTVLATVTACNSVFDANSRTNVAYSALDGFSAGGALSLDGCTVVGKVHATMFTLVSNCIFWAAPFKADPWAAPLWCDRKQEGCVRFSFLPIGAIVPRHFHCVQEALASPTPLFFSTHYGHPGYLKLLASTPDVIRRGADDQGEMGVFHFLLSPQRESDLRVRIAEYLPVGLEFGIIYQD